MKYLESGTYTYRTEMLISGYDPATVTLTGRWGADNSGRMLINGSVVSSEPVGFLEWRSISVPGSSGMFRSGQNTIEFEVINDSPGGSPTGLIVELAASAGSTLASDFTLVPLAKTRTAAIGVPTSFAIAINRVNFSQPITLTATAPGGTNTITIDPYATTASFSIASSQPSGATPHTVSISASGGGLTRTAQVFLNVLPASAPIPLSGTGAAPGTGALDSRYILTLNSDPLFPGIETRNLAAPTWLFGYWLGSNGPPVVSNWIGPRSQLAEGNSAGASDSSVAYRYETRFNMNGLTPSSSSLQLAWTADDGGRLKLNGTEVDNRPLASVCPSPKTNTFGCLKSISVPASVLVSGENKLEIEVSNGPSYGSRNPTGLWLEKATGTATPKTSSDFDIKAYPDYQAVMPGGSANFRVLLTRMNGFSDNPTLTVPTTIPQEVFTRTGLVRLGPDEEYTLEVDVNPTAPSGLYRIPILASNGGGLSYTITPALWVGQLPPSVKTISPNQGSGTTQTFLVRVDQGSGQLSRVQLFISDGELSAGGNNSCTIMALGDGAGGFRLYLGPDDWSTGSPTGGSYIWQNPAPLQNSQCRFEPAATTITINGRTVDLGFKVTFTRPNGTVWSGTKKLFVLATDLTGTTTLDDGYVKLGEFTAIGVAAPNFTLTAAPATITAGSSGTSSITISPQNGFNAPVTLTPTGWPPQITPAAITPNPVTGPAWNATVNIQVGGGVSAGPYVLPISGAAGSLSASGSIALTVNPGAGNSLPYGVSVTPANGTSAPNVANNLSLSFSSANGPSDIWNTQFLIQDASITTPTATNACTATIEYTNGTHFYDDAGAAGALVWLGASWLPSQENSRCILSISASAPVSIVGQNLVYSANLTFKPLWAGKQLRVFLRAANQAYQWGAWQQLGTFTVQ